MISKIAEAQPPERLAIHSGTELAYINYIRTFARPFLDEFHLLVRTQWFRLNLS